MRVIVRWTYAQGSAADLRLARFKSVLRAAQRTSWYQPMLERAGLATPEALRSVGSVEQTLQKLPAIELDEFRRFPEAFQSRRDPGPTLQRFQSPLAQTPKTAILLGGFVQTSNIKVIAQNWRRGLEHLAANALAAPLHVLRELAASIEDGHQEIGRLQHFVVPFTGGRFGELAESDRERFWRVFQVPVFEQRVGFDGRVIAYECEAHDGLHIMPECAAFEETAKSELLLTSLTDLQRPTLRVGTHVIGSIAQECCDCGNASARLMAARPLLAPPPLRAAAAAA